MYVDESELWEEYEYTKNKQNYVPVWKPDSSTVDTIQAWLISRNFCQNNHKEGKKVLSSIEDELMTCDKFQISVAFITMGGITPLLQTLKELEKNGIPGEILTTNYLNFSEPKALEKLHGLSNITLKMYDVEKALKASHKGIYIQKRRDLSNHYRKLKHDKRRTYE